MTGTVWWKPSWTEKRSADTGSVYMKNKEKWSMRIFFTIVVMGLALLVCLAADKPSQAEIAVISYAREHGISASEYPDFVIDMLERNPEMEEFVLNYPFREDLLTDLRGYDRSQGVPLLMQWDKRWGYLEYSGSLVAVTGSGPLCMAMVGYYLTGETKFYPENVVQFAIDNEFYAAGGSRQTLISEGGPALGLAVKAVSVVEDKMAIYLRAGNPMIAAVGPGDFTASSQFVVLTGWKDGMVTVHDPNSYVNSGKEWSYAELAPQITNLWVIKPGEAE